MESICECIQEVNIFAFLLKQFQCVQVIFNRFEFQVFVFEYPDMECPPVQYVINFFIVQERICFYLLIYLLSINSNHMWFVPVI